MSAVTKEEMHQAIDATKEELHQAIDETKKELHQAIDETKRELHQTIDETKKELHQAIDETKRELHQTIDETKRELHQAIDAAKEEMHQTINSATSELATKKEVRALKDEFDERFHQAQILNEDTNKTVHLMYELLLPKSEKIDRIDPLTDRVEQCEEDIDVIKLAVTSHTTNKDIHSS